MKLTPSLDTITVEPNKKSLFDFVQMLGKMWRNLAQAFNGQISFGDGTNSDNINGTWINTTTPVAPNTDFTVNHNLNRLPVGYLVMQKDRAVDVYTGSIAATTTQITLRATVASAVIRLFVFLALLSLAPLCFAQNTNVSGTITDAGGQTWNNGTITFIFNPGTASPPFANSGSPYTPVPISTTLNASGSFSALPIPSNSTITPTGTKWNVQVCPQSTSPCSLITSIFIFGATQDISASVIPPAISVSPTPGASAYADAQVKATKVGTHYYNLTSATDRVCSTTVADVCTVWANSGGGSNGGLTNLAPAGMINPAAPPYNAKFDAGAQNTCTTTNGNNIVTCPNAKFQTGTILSGSPPATVGQIIFANDATAGAGGVDTCLDNPDITFGGARQTTISSVDSDTQVHVVGNSNTTSTAHACVAWGDDDTTAINTAWAAGGCTSTAALPNAKALISAPIWQGIAGCPNVSASGTGYQGQRVIGSSVVGTYIIPTPLFNFSSIAGSGSPTCNNTTCKAAIGNPNIADYESFNVWGLGERCSANQANTTLWLVGLATRAINTNALGWCGRGGSATLSGYSVIGPTDIYTWGGSNFFGSIVMNFVSVLIYFGNSFISCNASSVNGTSGIVLQAGTSVNSQSNGLSCPVQVGVASGAGAVFNDTNSSINGNDSGNFCLYVGQNSVVNFANNNLVCAAPAVNEGAISFFSTSGTGGIVNATNSSLFANGTANTISFGTSNGIFRNNTGNVFSGGSGTFTGTGSLVQGSMSPSSFASMGTPANGSFLYCTDCTIANPCASGGSGALAKRLNNIWVCN